MIFKLIATLMLFGSVFKSSGQTTGKDSVLHRYYNKTGRSFLSKLNERKSNIDSAFFYLRKAVYLVDSANPANNLRINESLCLLAEAYFKSEHFAVGKKIFLQVTKKYHQSGEKKKEADVWYRQAKILHGMGVQYDDIDSAYGQASRLYFESGNLHNKIDTDCDLANYHFISGKHDLAIKETLATIEISRKNGGHRLTFLLLFLAAERRYTGQFNEGLKAAMEAQKNVEKNNDTLARHDVFGEFALEYEEMNDPERAVYWYKECINERLKRRLSGYLIYRTTYLMIVQMLKIKREQEALLILQNLKKATPPASPIENAILSQSLAYCYNAIGEYGNAEKYFLSMIKIYNEVEQNNDILFIANLDIGKFYVTQQQYATAEPFLKSAFARLDGPSVSRIKDLHLYMFKVDSAAGHYISAIDHFQQYKALNDSLFNEAKSKQIEELNIKYDVEKKQQNLTILQKENTVQQNSLKQERLSRNLMLGGVVVLALFAGLLYNRFQLKQRANKQLQASQEKIEKQNISLQHLVREKDWLVKEIHHRVKNNLHTISGLLDAQSGYLESNEALTAISDSQHRVQAMSLLHQKLFNSENLSSVEMPEYIHELVGHLEHSFGTQQKIKFHLDIDSLQLNLSHALPIGLILNEAITNAIKYAFPGGQDGTINVQLKKQTGNQCLLLIADNGKGLPADFNSQQSHSMGMSLMRGLSEDINGVFLISNNNGTEINISFAFEIATDDHASFYSSQANKQS